MSNIVEPKVKVSKSVHNTCDVVIYGMPNSKIVDWFSLMDIWGSKGYDRFNDNGLYFELPEWFYSAVENLPFVSNYKIKVEIN